MPIFFIPSRPWTRRWLMALLALALHAGAFAQTFLEPERAFRFAARVLDERTVDVEFTVAPGYYLYREKLAFEAAGAVLGTPQLPLGKVKFDETFRKDVETYRDVLRVAVPVTQAAAGFRLIVTSQGCADAGLCYPPMRSGADISLAGFGGNASVRVLAPAELEPEVAASAREGASAAGTGTAAQGGGADSSHLDAALQSGRFWSVIGAFLVAGVLLSFTPCVLPMLPILSTIIVGQQGGGSRGRSLALAASYSLGMAVVYTAFGIAAGLVGEGLAATLQTPWVLLLFGVALVVFSLSMFGVYELRLPGALIHGVSHSMGRLRGGHAASVFAMGGVSALIVSPCVVAPLAGALVYLSQTRDVALGGSALFALAAGMSVPLLLLGASAGALLPKAGPWMEGVKRFFGVLLLGVAIWIVQPVLPAALGLVFWGALAVFAAVLVWGGRSTGPRPAWRNAVAGALVVLGLFEWVGAASGAVDPLQPLARLRHGADGASDAVALRFQPVRSTAELDAVLASAGRPVMLDFYADWCVSCKEMERYTFSDPAVRSRLAKAVLLKADVTANNAKDRELLKRFQLFGPPGTLFFGARGQEISGTRVIGYQTAARFAQTLEAAGL
ncbi:MAG: protein-disulfide reductase DsbD [Burkholderiaceae bacterium]